MIKDKKFLITGASGQLAQEFIRFFDKQGLNYYAPNEDGLDITDFGQVKKAISKYNPDIILNCAAYNEVDAAEDHPEKAFSVNSEAVRNLAEACKDLGIFMVHFSSDYVFDGKNGKSYYEDDKPCPSSVYGESKLQGEKEVEECADKYLIFRLSWVFGKGKSNFLYKILELSKNTDCLKIVKDEISSPTFTADVVRVVLLSIERDLRGLYHLTNSGFCSRYDWGKYYFQKMEKKMKIISANSSEFVTKAQRPAYSVMSNKKLSEELDIVIPDWKDAVDRFLSGSSSMNIN